VFSKSTITIILIRPTQSIMNIPFKVNRFHNSFLLIVTYKYLKSCSEDFILKNLILRTKSCGTTTITLNIVGFFISARQKSAWWK